MVDFIQMLGIPLCKEHCKIPKNKFTNSNSPLVV